MEFKEIEFEPVTIFYGGNGTGKTTLLNIIAEKLRLIRNSVFNRSNFFRHLCFKLFGRYYEKNSAGKQNYHQ